MTAHPPLQVENRFRVSTSDLEEISELAREPGRRLRLDFTQVELLSAAWMGRVVTLHRAALAQGGRLIPVNVHPLLLEGFEVAGLSQVLDVRSWDR